MSESASKDSSEQAEFRQYCREWLRDNTPGEPSVRLPLSALEIMTHVVKAWIEGRQIDLASRHTGLYDKYRNRPRRDDSDTQLKPEPAIEN